MSINVGDIIDGKYRIENYIGSGTTCHVYKAIDVRKKSIVAIKIVKGEILTPTTGDGRSADKRLDKEIEFLQQLKDHANIIPILDKGIHNDLKFLVMEFMEFNLGDYFDAKKRYLPVGEILTLMERIASAIDYAHKEVSDMGKKTIIHRDIKPANILLRWESSVLTPYVADFDVAVLSENVNNASVIATKVGTFLYKAPETFKGIYTPASDIYALGVMLYELLDGFPPFNGNSEITLMNKHLGEDVPYSQFIEQKVGLGTLKCIEKCLSKDASERYHTAGEFMDAVYENYKVWLEKKSSIHTAKVANRIQWLLLFFTIIFGLFGIFGILRNADASSKSSKPTEIAEAFFHERRVTLESQESQSPTFTIIPSDPPSYTPTATTTPTSTDTATNTSTPTDTPTATSTPCSIRSDWAGIYRIQQDDTLSAIALSFQINVFDFAWGNCIDPEDPIFPGQTLHVPYRAPTNTPTSRPLSTSVSNQNPVIPVIDNTGGHTGGNQIVPTSPPQSPATATPTPIIESIRIYRGGEQIVIWNTGSSGNSLSVEQAQGIVIHAIVQDPSVESVKFESRNHTNCESDGDFTYIENNGASTFPIGTHSISVTAWSLNNCVGSNLGTYTINFTVG